MAKIYDDILIQTVAIDKLVGLADAILLAACKLLSEEKAALKFISSASCIAAVFKVTGSFPNFITHLLTLISCAVHSCPPTSSHFD